MKSRFLLGMAVFALSPLMLFAAPLPDELLSLINDERTKLGIPALSEQSKLAQGALLKATDIRIKGDLIHTKGTLWWPLEMAGYGYSSAGENLALTFGDSSVVVREWMESSAHRENLLNAHFSEAGIAVIPAIVQGHEGWFAVFYGAEPKQEEVARLEQMYELLQKISLLVGKLAATSNALQ